MPKLVPILLIAAMIIAWRILPDLKSSTPQSEDILMQILGGTAQLISMGAYREADVYFHGGAMERCSESEENEHAHQHALSASLPGYNIIRQMQDEAAPKEHRHLEGKEASEMLPWFMVAVRIDPHNIDAWRVGSYWFYRAGFHDKALDFITEGMKHNPLDYRLYYDRGVLYHRMGQWKKAVDDLQMAKKLWANISEDSPNDRTGIEDFLRDSIKKYNQHRAVNRSK